MSDILLAARAPPPVNTDPTVQAGAGFLGCIMVYLLFGVLLSQLMTYLGSFVPTGRWYTSSAGLVAAVVTMAFTNLCIVTYNVWQWLIIDTNVPSGFWIAPSVSLATPVLHGLIAFCVQCFFVNKVWRLGMALKKPMLRIPGVIIALLAVFHLISGIALSIVFAIGGRLFGKPMDIVVSLNLATALAADAAITISMILLLSHYKRRSSFSTTKQLLTTITRHTIENGLVPTVCALVNMVVYYTRRNDSLHLIFQWMIGQLYAIVLVISLNRARQTADGSTVSQGTHSHSLSGNALQLSQRHVRMTTEHSHAHGGPVQVSVVRQVDVEHDSGDDAASAVTDRGGDLKAVTRISAWDDSPDDRMHSKRTSVLYPNSKV